MKIAILSNVTVEVLAGMSDDGHSVWTAPGFGGWMEAALAPSKELADFGPEAIYLLLDNHFEGARGWTQAEIASAKSALGTSFPGVPVVVPDLAAMARDVGDAFYDSRMWALGKMPWSLVGLKEIRKLFGLKKALAVDFDGTLWRGVIGEDGVGGISPDREFQLELKHLKERGTLLVGLSKNNADDVAPVWDVSRMILNADDFVACRINWEPKAKNLLEVANELNLGLDAFVFVDDNPSERAEMRSRLAEVCVAEFPPALETYFPMRKTTDEDKAKTEQYRAETKRRESAAGLTMDEYLKSLEMVTDIHEMREEEIARVAQLSQKSNQFNVCTNRYVEADFRRMVEEGRHLIATMRSGDRFGDLGLVAFVVVEMTAPSSARVVDFVMSCRAMNRRLEHRLWSEAEQMLSDRGITEFESEWRQSAKNAPTRNLFEDLGFELVSDDTVVRRYRKYHCRLPN